MGTLKVVHDAYISIKRDAHFDLPERTPNEPPSFHERRIFELRSPMGNTMLHVAALYGNYGLVMRISQFYQKLLTVKNVNGDTALHLAAKARHIEILKRLLVLHHSYFNFRLRANDNKKAIERIFAENKKGNTFLHEAILNRHDDVVNFALTDEIHSCFHDDSVFKNLMAEMVLTYRNKENKSILYLAIEAGNKEPLIEHWPKPIQIGFPLENHSFLPQS